MFPASLIAGPLGNLAKDKVVGLVKDQVEELFDKDGNKVPLPKAKTPSRALAQAILATADFIEASGGSDEDRVDAVEGMLQMVWPGNGEVDSNHEEADDDDGHEPPG